MKHVTLVAALEEQGCIGRGNRLLWHLPDDMKHFRAYTAGKPVVMGRLTFESIGRLLPGRLNIIMSRRPDYQQPGAVVVASLDEAIDACGECAEVCIIGGADVYAQAMPKATRMVLTRVHTRLAGDAWFPGYNPADWQVLSEKHHEADERHPYAFTIQVVERLPVRIDTARCGQ